MATKLLLLLALTLMPLLAANPPKFVYWPQGAPPANGPKGVKFDNHSLGVSHRDHSGLAEVHENQTDIMVIEKGEADLIAGGELVGGKTIRPGELQAVRSKPE